MKQITLPTTPAQREAFKALGLTLWKEMLGEEEFWDLNDHPAVRLRKDRAPMFYTNPGAGPMIDAQVLQILGVLEPPPGMVLVPADRLTTLETEAKLLREAVDGIQAALDDESLDVFDQVEVIRELLPTIDGQPASPEQGKENPNG